MFHVKHFSGLSTFLHWLSTLYKSKNSYGFPILSINFIISTFVITNDALLSFGWKLTFSASLNRESTNNITSCASSFTNVNSDTDPGFTPKYFIIRSGDANDSFP